MIKIKLSTKFSINIANEIFTLNLKLLNALGDVLFSYAKDNKGNYHLLPSGRTSGEKWEPLSAGLAAICNFLDYHATDELKIIIKKIVKNTEKETESVEKLKDQEIEISFSNLPFNDVPKELQKGAMKFYLLEKILNETSVEDIKQIGFNKLIPREIELKYIEKHRKEFDKKNEKEVLRVAGFDFNSPILYSVDFIKKDKIRIFFQSGIEEKEKIIKVLYCTGINCENTKQRIRKVNTQNELFNDGITVSYCSDWEINTIGENKIIKDFAVQVSKNLSIFLDVSEQFIRTKEFDVLWDMCKTSS
jgi:hypothetical protein